MNEIEKIILSTVLSSLGTGTLMFFSNLFKDISFEKYKILLKIKRVYNNKIFQNTNKAFHPKLAEEFYNELIDIRKDIVSTIETDDKNKFILDEIDELRNFYLGYKVYIYQKEDENTYIHPSALEEINKERKKLLDIPPNEIILKNQKKLTNKFIYSNLFPFFYNIKWKNLIYLPIYILILIMIYGFL